MNFGLFEPLFGKQIPKTPEKLPEQSLVEPATVGYRRDPQPKAKVSKKLEAKVQPLSNSQLGMLFNELDQSKIIILVLAIAVAIMFVFFYYLNTRQKSQKQLIYKMQKQLKRLRG